MEFLHFRQRLISQRASSSTERDHRQAAYSDQRCLCLIAGLKKWIEKFTHLFRGSVKSSASERRCQDDVSPRADETHCWLSVTHWLSQVSVSQPSSMNLLSSINSAKAKLLAPMLVYVFHSTNERPSTPFRSGNGLPPPSAPPPEMRLLRFE